MDLARARPGLREAPAAGGGDGYAADRARVEDYFDRSATKAWADLTSDAPVSRVRATVRAGRDRMRAVMLDRLPADLTGARVLDAGCGTGAKAAELAARGAEVVAIDISPNLVAIAARRHGTAGNVTFGTGDMFDPALGTFDAVVAQDSMIYYAAPDLAARLDALAARSPQVVFTVAPRTPLLTLMWRAGKLFPRADRSPVMVPQDHRALAARVSGRLERVERVTSGFYISECLELRA